MFPDQMDVLLQKVAIGNWAGTAVLVAIRISALFVFAPILSSSAIAIRVKAGFTVALTVLIAPLVVSLPGSKISLDCSTICGELGIGLLFGLSMMMISETLAFAAMLVGMQFSFSLVNLLDPNTMIETPVLGQMLNWLCIITLLDAGLHRTMIGVFIRTFSAVPVGGAVFEKNGVSILLHTAGSIFSGGLQLAAPVMAAALAVEVALALIGRLSPQLPAMALSIPIKTSVSYLVLIASLSFWPGWIETHFTRMLHSAALLVASR